MAHPEVDTSRSVALDSCFVEEEEKIPLSAGKQLELQTPAVLPAQPLSIADLFTGRTLTKKQFLDTAVLALTSKFT